jgi:hypothetical protein
MPFGFGLFITHTAPLRLLLRRPLVCIVNFVCIVLCAQHELRSPGCETLRVHVSRHLHTTLAVVHNRRSGQGAPLPGADVGGDKTASGQSQTLQLVLPRHGTITQNRSTR